MEYTGIYSKTPEQIIEHTPVVEEKPLKFLNLFPPALVDFPPPIWLSTHQDKLINITLTQVLTQIYPAKLMPR